MATPRVRHTESDPCGVCSGFQRMQQGKGERCWGFTSGDYVHCTRPEHAYGLPFNDSSATYAHYMKGECRCGVPHGISKSAPKATRKVNAPTMAPQIVATFDYRDSGGKLVFQSVRYEPKEFKLRRPDGNGGFSYNIDGIQLVPYRLQELLASIASDETVFLPEGEKHCDRLVSEGLIATCNAMGAEKWRDEYSPYLQNRDIVILPDNDEVGQRHAVKMAKSLKPYARSIRLITLEGLPNKGDVLDWLEAGHTIDELRLIADKSIPLTGGSSDGTISKLLDEIESFIGRYVVLTSHQCCAITLWIAHAHVIDAFETTPYISVRSAEKRSGKSRLLEVAELLVPNALKTENISIAAIAHSIENGATLLLDETDTLFKTTGGKSETMEMLRGILDGGYRVTGSYVRMSGTGANMVPKKFSTYGPKMLAGIGKLPGTLGDRSIDILMKRKARNEYADRFRYRDARNTAEPLMAMLESWAISEFDLLRDARPYIPDALDDRQQDAWEPLLAIADSAGGNWARRARDAALTLSTGETHEDDSVGVRLLSDIKVILSDRSKVSSVDLLAALNGIEDAPWGDWYGKPLNARALAKLLKPYGIRPTPVRTGSKVWKGYSSADFADAFPRYTETLSVTSVTPAYEVLEGKDLSVTHPTSVTDNEPQSIALRSAVTDVTDKNGDMRCEKRESACDVRGEYADVVEDSYLVRAATEAGFQIVGVEDAPMKQASFS